MQQTHIKDSLIHHGNMWRRGFMVATPSALNPGDRSRTFTAHSWGYGEDVWRKVITTPRLMGYDGCLSVEMESDDINIDQGLR